jgi:hypothetical protein
MGEGPGMGRLRQSARSDHAGNRAFPPGVKGSVVPTIWYSNSPSTSPISSWVMPAFAHTGSKWAAMARIHSSFHRPRPAQRARCSSATSGPGLLIGPTPNQANCDLSHRQSALLLIVIRDPRFGKAPDLPTFRKSTGRTLLMRGAGRMGSLSSSSVQNLPTSPRALMRPWR